jgi:hypothetical protein
VQKVVMVGMEFQVVAVEWVPEVLFMHRNFF